MRGWIGLLAVLALFAGGCAFATQAPADAESSRSFQGKPGPIRGGM
ncbi:MAG: hypothetical protein HYV62_04760 [Candidatus Rokubacteria bacterium]|nr:hypothetical protein [Candidatus Rokubacteria bacterium]